MNLLMIAWVSWIGGGLSQPPVAPADKRFVICTEFTDNANAVLRTALLKRGDLGIEIRSVRSADLLEEIIDATAAGPEDSPTPSGATDTGSGVTYALVGYSVPILLQAAQVLPMSASPGIPTGRTAFRPDDRAYEGLWIDPLGVAYHLGTTGGEISSQSVEGQLPERLEDLAEGRYEGLLLAETPRADNATGLLLTRIAGTNGGVISAKRPLERLDANVRGGYAVSLDSLMSRLTGGKVSFAITTQRASLFWQVRDPELRFRPIGDDACALILGASIGLGNAVAAEALWGVLADPVVVSRLSIVEHLVPAGESIPDSSMPTWAPAIRDGLIESDGLLAAEASKASGVVRYFQDEIQGVFASRRDRFSEYYDAAGILLVVVFVIWMLRRTATRESVGNPPPESR